MNKHIAVIGSTGATGTEVVRLGLERGHRIIAVARDPAELTHDDRHLERRQDRHHQHSGRD